MYSNWYEIKFVCFVCFLIPSNYRPSVLCKVLERLVNVRLLKFLDLKGTLSLLECGSRAKRTTVDHLLSLKATVRKVQANSEQLVSIFFDIENTETWSHGDTAS